MEKTENYTKKYTIAATTEAGMNGLSLKHISNIPYHTRQSFVPRSGPKWERGNGCDPTWLRGTIVGGANHSGHAQLSTIFCTLHYHLTYTLFHFRRTVLSPEKRERQWNSLSRFETHLTTGQWAYPRFCGTVSPNLKKILTIFRLKKKTYSLKTKIL